MWCLYIVNTHKFFLTSYITQYISKPGQGNVLAVLRNFILLKIFNMLGQNIKKPKWSIVEFIVFYIKRSPQLSVHRNFITRLTLIINILRIHNVAKQKVKQIWICMLILSWSSMIIMLILKDQTMSSVNFYSLPASHTAVLAN